MVREYEAEMEELREKINAQVADNEDLKGQLRRMDKEMEDQSK